MSEQSPAPSAETIDWWHDRALDFLRDHFRETTPARLGEYQIFDRSPLDGDGATIVFRFSADRAGAGAENFIAVVGQTEPNYYPDEGFAFDEAFELHLGTRFMLTLGVAQVREADEPVANDDQPYDVEKDVRLIVNRVSPDAKIDRVELAALFDVGGQFFAVIRCLLDGQPVYVMGRDAPFGFSMRTDLAPQVVFRLHLGRVLRLEPDPDAQPGD